MQVNAPCLATAGKIRRSIRRAPRKVLDVLHRLLFEEAEYDEGNLLNFPGFKLTKDELEVKINSVKLHFKKSDLVAACLLLDVDYEGCKEDIIRRLFATLSDLNQLMPNIDDDVDNESDNENDDLRDAGKDDDEDARNKMKVLPKTTCKEEREVARKGVRNLKHEHKTISDFESDDDDNDCINSRMSVSRFAMNYRDVEDSIRKYDGTNSYPVERWIDDFEETAILMRWDSLQRLIFAKRSLVGLAKMYVQSMKGITSWSKLKNALKQEFSYKINSAQLHAELCKRKMRKDETVQEYFIIMRELASRGTIEDEALIQYIIDGIPDDAHKVILCGATNIDEFRQKVKVYDGLHSRLKQEKQSWRSGKQTKVHEDSKSHVTNDDKKKNCFNCGSRGHKSTECKFKEKGPKCFKCNKFGHIAKNCGSSAGNSFEVSTETNSYMICATRRMYKEIIVETKTLDALIDTGSDFTMVRQDVYEKLGKPKLHQSNLCVSGLGNTPVLCSGYFDTVIQIEQDDFSARVYVLPKSAIAVQFIIGNDVLSQAEVTINHDKVSIRKLTSNSFLASIFVAEEREHNIGPDVKGESRALVRDLLNAYTPLTVSSCPIEMNISVKDEHPIYSGPRRLPFSERDIVDKQVDEWIRNGIVEPCSSEYASQVIVTRKKDGSPRVCIDYRKVNKLIVKDRYPLPLIEDQLDKLQGAKIFSTLDLKNGFFHVPVAKDSRRYTAFVTHRGQYQFLRAPFGLCNSPAVFQRFVNTIFRKLSNEGVVLTYMDDLIIPSSSVQEGIEKLRMVLETARANGLEINFKKCSFLMKEVEFLGYVIRNGQISPSPLKTAAVQNFPEPTCLKNVQSYLGLTSYFRKFIPNFSKIAKPLSDLLKNNIFKFDVEERRSFEQLKQLLANKPVLQIFHQEYQTEVHTDACKDGYGAVLLQKCPEDGAYHPVYYMSRKTTPAEQRYSSYELEVLAIIEALKKFRVYLLGRRFTLVTDCSAFQKTMEKKELTTRIARWALLLEDYDYTIVHRPGVRMKHVDALSRNPVVMFAQAGELVSRIKASQDDDEKLRTIKDLLTVKPYDDYFMKHGVLYKFVDGRDLLVVPKSMQTEIIQDAHGKGHFAAKRTEELIKQEYFIPGITQRIQRFISNCITCILANRKNGRKEGLLHPVEKGDTPLHTYHMDHLGPLESTNKNYKHVLAVIDAFSKFVWLYPTKSTTSKEVISKLEVQKSTFGNPARIVSDKGTAFTSQEFKDYCTAENIEHIAVTTGLPRANGQIERINRTIIPVLTKMSLNDPTKWYKFVPDLQRVLNSTYQRSIDRTPFEVLVGVKLRSNTDKHLTELIERELIQVYDAEREEQRKDAKKQILRVQDENRRTYNLRRRPASSYKVGDLVAIKRTQSGPGLKLKPKFLGPYRVLKVKLNDTYDVEKEGVHEGPKIGSTVAEYMKPWTHTSSASESDA